MSASTIAKITSRWEGFVRNLVNAKDSIIRCYEALKGSVLWILHLPNAAATVVSRWISSTGRAVSDVGQMIKAAIQAILRVLVIGVITVLSLMLLCVTVLVLVKVYRTYQRKRHLRRQHKLNAQRRKEDVERRARERQKQAREAQRRAANDHHVYRQ
ncbi:uncharacterized protein M421DRAFT_94786 [Didymella exigua CBS 183.55]|uniref:Uncharacterized protein n=1 Tax=Didymella exigua CBS 183.55 TaxID=1150837 RepID=A0A6A5RD57_9PLEO|nr:uncharacterized protein M421DRAFT_94786 [Didymella exigua CBS 183.55]KAF1925329.1 hypothetical protein M421DRAFT_94786 [Didymella exigua CBS 183.55]